VSKTTAPTGSTATWYLRSYRDEDTHLASAIATDDTITSRCGAIFVPMLHPIDGIPARLRHPMSYRSAHAAAVVQREPAALAGSSRRGDAATGDHLGRTGTPSSPMPS
jgi:hypothetical protein